MATTVRLNSHDQAVLDSLVESEHLSANEVIRRAILDRAARRGLSEQTRTAFAEGEERWAGLLDRLRQV